MEQKAYEITGTTRLGGLLGSPVSHSLSPQMHNASFRKLGIDAVYLCFDVGPEKLGAVVSALRDMNVYGFNLTMPDKEAVLPYLDELSDGAAMIGAVNTVVQRGGRLIGHNTDGAGFMHAARDAGFEAPGREMTLIGAGGAGSAIAVQAALDGVKTLHLFNRKSASFPHAEQLAERIGRGTACRAEAADLADTAYLQECLNRSDLLVNATSVGMEPHAEGCPLPETIQLSPPLLVGDVIYHPAKTRLLEMAEAHGCRTFNGMFMLLWQGAEAFRLWTGREMPAGWIRERYF